MNVNKLICVISTDSAGDFSYFGTDKHVYYYCLNDRPHKPIETLQYSKALLSREIKIERIKAREVFNMHTVKLYA